MEPDRYLTVAEAAEVLRLSSQTVYRWCRSGELHAVKLGKEWRIPRDAVGTAREPAHRLPLAQLFPALAERPGHLMGIVEDRQAVGRMAALFAESAAAKASQFLYLRWTEDPEEVQQSLRPAITPQRQESKLRIIDMAQAYEQQGIDSVDGAFQEFKEAGEHDCGLSSPYGYFSRYVERLAQLEVRLQTCIEDRSFCLLCLYALADMDTTRVLPPLVELMEQHNAVVFFDGEYALLLRPRA